ncbi:sodium/hydrogen exchanger [Methanolacinia petrolearia DSM 11571]|uniref:Sodium/hydrogen exchanger n=1 Tax=Methanolacinia petrolearia (strain DSM 11571 / OCM 486 / SEBR 4847) TaxID=679926 RepID=E1RD38_METP4|nr:cation:proton antiporter [Methanolacinia petrolearia]ADN35938.1 sodium/hydrogen exchanger [Methanolacinia petrolearia DSM 11571]
METETELITAVFIILACALAVIFVGRRFRLPMIIGYFLTGIIVGPSLLGLVTEEQVELLAELGVIFLMFTIGLEMSLKNLLAMWKKILVSGGLQLLITAVVVWLIMTYLGYSTAVSILTAFLVAPSSTAIIMNLYQQKGEINTPHGKTSLGLLIFQDISVIPMMLIIPILAGTSGGSIPTEILSLIFGLIILAFVLIAAIFFVPRLLIRVAAVRNNELFIITIVVICFGIAWLMSLNGVSLALGAFLAGIAISESEYSHEVVGQIMPIRDILTSFFFVSIGMMVSLSFLGSHLVMVVLLAAAVIVGKSLINFVSIKATGADSGAAFMSAVGISQIGEFSFIIGSTGLVAGIITNDFYQIFLAISIVTMAVTPFLVDSAPRMARALARGNPVPNGNAPLSFGGAAGTAPGIAPVPGEEPKEHVIIVGYGVVGQYVAKAFRRIGMDYVILELNPDTIRDQRKKGEKIVYGDARHESVLEFAGIDMARAIVLTIPDTQAVKAVITAIRRKNPKIGIITRSRFISEIADLYHLGADEVIVDEREAAIQIFRRILANEQVPQQELDQYARQIRCELYDTYFEKPVLSHLKSEPKPGFFEIFGLRIREAEERMPKTRNSVEQIHVGKNSDACGKKLSELHLRANYGVTVIAVRRVSAGDAEVNPDKNTVLYEGDTAVVIGERTSINMIIPMFTEKSD